MKGIYNVELSVEDPIIGESDNYSRLIDIANGIEDNINYFTQIAVYPNPANAETELYIQLSAPAVVDVNLTDILGKLIKKICAKKMNTENTIHVSTFDIPAGNYYIKISAEKETFNKKLIIIK